MSLKQVGLFGMAFLGALLASAHAQQNASLNVRILTYPKHPPEGAPAIIQVSNLKGVVVEITNPGEDANHVAIHDVVNPSDAPLDGYYCILTVLDSNNAEVPVKIFDITPRREFGKDSVTIRFELPDTKENRLAKIRERMEKDYQAELAEDSSSIKIKLIQKFGLDNMITSAEKDYFENKPGHYTLTAKYLCQKPTAAGNLVSLPVEFEVVDRGSPSDYFGKALP